MAKCPECGSGNYVENARHKDIIFSGYNDNGEEIESTITIYADFCKDCFYRFIRE